MRRSDEVAINDDRRILNPGCTGGFGVGLHDEFGVGDAVVEPRHAMAGNNLRAGCQHRPSADASDDSAPRADVLYEFGDARIFGEQGRAFGATWNKDAHIVLGPGVRNRALDVQQPGPCEVAVNLDRLLTRGHHLDVIAGFVEGDRRTTDRTNNAAFTKSEVRGLLFFQKGPRDLQVRVLLHVCRRGLANQHCVIRLGLCPITG
jgi:hypothetical protein